MTVEIPHHFDYAVFYQKMIDRFDHEPWRACEVGVFNGASALYLLKNSKNLELHLVDHFKASQIFHTLTYLRDYYDRIVVHPTTSERAANRFIESNTAFDFVFLDADHSFKVLLDDIKAFSLCMKDHDKSILAGHDFTHHKYKVKKAVDFFYGSEYSVWENRVWYDSTIQI